jgi:aromatic-L-amino-acid decarboxylase
MPDQRTGADTAHLTQAIEQLLPSLEEVWRYEGLETALRDRATWLAGLEGPLPAAGAGLDAVLEELQQHVIPYGPRMGKPGFSGWITAGPTTAGVAAQLAATAVSPQRYLLTAFNHLEGQSLRWLQELLGIPATFQGVYATGGSVANLIGLGAARQHAYEQRGRDVAALGLDAPGRLYTSVESHHTVARSAAVLGLGRSATFLAPVDHEQRVDVAAIAAAIDRDLADGIVPVAVVGVAGTTNTGAIDDLSALAEVAHERGVWFHVDGAYGLFGVTDPDQRPRYEGYQQADSMIVDPHKWLAAPCGIGAAFVRDAALLHRAFTQGEAEYLEGSFSAEPTSPFDSMGVAYADFGVELSSPARGVVVWALLREIGAEGVRAIVQRDVAFAQHLAERARRHPRLQLVTEPKLSICCFRYRPEGAPDADGDEDEAGLADLNARILSALRRDTPYAPSSTVVDGRYALRPCYVNARTTLADVDGLADAVVAIGDRLVAEAAPGPSA